MPNLLADPVAAPKRDTSSPATRGVMFQYFEWNSPADGSLWDELAFRATELHNLGVTAVWMPPAYKDMAGGLGVGYGVYDLYDLGEFDQKGSVRTRYGTRDQYLAAVKAVKEAGMFAYADVVFNHRMGADSEETITVVEVDKSDRSTDIGGEQEIRVWSRFDFAGRAGQYSEMTYNAEHFGGFGLEDENGVQHVYHAAGRDFSGEVSLEHGNFDYLMGCDVDLYHDAVRDDLFHWGRWIVDTANLDGFRLDAVKHIPASFYRDWFNHLRTHFGDRDLFGVGEYWSNDVGELQNYLDVTEGVMRLLDVPLHFKFMEASRQGRDFDLRTIFDGSLLQANPLMTVTFVDNHDTQPGQSLESWIDDWFKPLAYALILLRHDGYPCVFYGDYFGNASEHTPLTSHRKLIDDMLGVRQRLTWGDQHDYFDHPQCVGWVWSGDDRHPGSMVVLMSVGDDSFKTMKTFRGKCTYRDITGGVIEPVTTDDDGMAEFHCRGGSVSIWVAV